MPTVESSAMCKTRNGEENHAPISPQFSAIYLDLAMGISYSQSLLPRRLCHLGAKTPGKPIGRGLRLRPSVTGVKLDILLGNANTKYDPNRESEVDIQTGTLVPDRVHVAGKRKCQL